MTDNKWRSFAILCVAEILTLALWFSATAIVPDLKREFAMDPFHASLFTSAVQIGFVFGTLISAVLGLADRLEPRRFFSACALTAGLANLAIVYIDPLSPEVLALRFITGACMAGVYPVGMKIAATWAKGDLGFLVGALVGALTLGSAFPHLFNGLGGIDWKFTLTATSVSALAAAVLINFATLGPNISPARKFHPNQALQAWKTPALRLANFGYLGHMWELYAMWAWIVVFLQASFEISMESGMAGTFSKFAAFATVAAGAVGCFAGGYFADRLGRTTVTIASMAISGACAVIVGFLFGGNSWVLMMVCLIWGVTIVSDSAQFSASIAELSDPALVGTMLTVQTSAGFLLTLIPIHLIPWLAGTVGWNYAFAALAIGPVIGIVAMARLRALPEAKLLAGGRR